MLLWDCCNSLDSVWIILNVCLLLVGLFLPCTSSTVLFFFPLQAPRCKMRPRERGFEENPILPANLTLTGSCFNARLWVAGWELNQVFLKKCLIPDISQYSPAFMERKYTQIYEQKLFLHRIIDISFMRVRNLKWHYLVLVFSNWSSVVFTSEVSPQVSVLLRPI